MSKKPPLLSAELSALVHHVELHRAGWPEKTLRRLALAVLWLEKKSLRRPQIARKLLHTFGISVNNDKLSAIINSLQDDDFLIESPPDTYRLSIETSNQLNHEIDAAKHAEHSAREAFCRLIAQSCSDLNAPAAWSSFQTKFLAPMIRDIGANTYRLITGEIQTVDDRHAETFLSRYGPRQQTLLKTVITAFLNPQNDPAREYISRMLHAYFCVEASGVSTSVIDRIDALAVHRPRFCLFVDTNFLFSLLGLHSNPSNTSVAELNALLATLSGTPQVELYVTPNTIREAKAVLASTKDRVTRVPPSPNFMQAALSAGMSGLAERFFVERQRNIMLTPAQWFDPYLNDLVLFLHNAGVALYNEKLDQYGTRQDVVDDIHLVMNHEKAKYPEDGRKPYESVAHDVILWHLIRDRRPAHLESIAEAHYWILTVDYRLIGFDALKVRRRVADLPSCLHPTSFIQLLQFWIPRTRKFEEAMLGGLRTPFLFQEFGPGAERVSLSIISRLGRYEGSESIPSEMITKLVTNDALRSRLVRNIPEDEADVLVKDALLSEINATVEAERTESVNLRSLIDEKNTALSESQTTLDSKDAEIQKLRATLRKEVSKRRESQRGESLLSKKNTQLQSNLQEAEGLHRQQRSIVTYFFLLGITIVASAGLGLVAITAVPSLSDDLGFEVAFSATSVLAFIVTHLLLEWSLGRQQRYAGLWWFKQVKRFRRWLWGVVVISILTGIVAPLIANAITP